MHTVQSDSVAGGDCSSGGFASYSCEFSGKSKVSLMDLKASDLLPQLDGGVFPESILSPNMSVALKDEFPLMKSDGTDRFLLNDELFRQLVRDHGFSFVDPDNPKRGVLDKSGYLVHSRGFVSTLEMYSPQLPDLFALHAARKAVLRSIFAVGSSMGFVLIGHGSQLGDSWKTRLNNLNPRFRILNQVFGEEALMQFSDYASTRLCVLSGSQNLWAMSLLSLCAPALVKWFANHAIDNGAPNGYHARRLLAWTTLEGVRSGYQQRTSLHVWSGFSDWRQHVFHLPAIMVGVGGTYQSEDKKIGDLRFDSVGQAREAIIGALTAFYPEVNPLLDSGMVEFRTLCQQLPGEEIVAHAVVLGLVASLNHEGSSPKRGFADSVFNTLEPDTISKWLNSYSSFFGGRGRMLLEMHEFFSRAIKSGSSALFEHGRRRTTAWFMERLFHFAYDGLRLRGKGEERFLEPLKHRILCGVSPADELLARYYRSGLGSVFDRVTHTPARLETIL